MPTMSQVTLTINLRDSGGTPLDAPGLVTLRGGAGNGYRTTPTRDASAAVFQNIGAGEYDAEAQALGYQTTTEHISISGIGSMMHVYIYLPRESEVKASSPAPSGTVMSPKLRSEIEKGINALRRRQFEVAREHFAKGARMAPGNPDVAYLLGVAQLGLKQTDLARQNFEHALSLDPGHQRSLLALGELQLESGDPAAAASTLEKAYRLNGADWRTLYLLASAYAKTARLAEAETYAERAARLARDKAPNPLLLLGEIQQAEGKSDEARQTWEKLVSKFPNDPVVQQAKQKLATLSQPENSAAGPGAEMTSLPVPVLPSLALAPPTEQPWAPPDIDSLVYPLAENAPCSAEEILPRAERRLRSEMMNFERFTATEHIEHQEINRYGRPGPIHSRDFSYLVFVHRFNRDSYFLEEERVPLRQDSNFPTYLATTGLNNLGVAVLQPAEQEDLVFRCEGLASVRGRAAWQIRFEEKKDSARMIRTWRRNGKIYRIPLKGRLWISSGSFEVVRIETDLLEPDEVLGLTRDHLEVNYGPVKFRGGTTTLWLPGSAEMHMELHGHRYHDRHYLSDYLLFEVDTNHEIEKPKETQSTPAAETQTSDPS